MSKNIKVKLVSIVSEIIEALKHNFILIQNHISTFTIKK